MTFDIFVIFHDCGNPARHSSMFLRSKSAVQVLCTASPISIVDDVHKRFRGIKKPGAYQYFFYHRCDIADPSKAFDHHH